MAISGWVIDDLTHVRRLILRGEGVALISEQFSGMRGPNCI